LVAMLEWLCDELKKGYAIGTRVQVLGAARVLPFDTQLSLFRIAQEVMTNIRKHAEASRADITLEMRDVHVQMTISDNGKGFKLPEQISH